MTSPVKTEWISLSVAGSISFDAYLARPPAGRGPGLVLFQEIFGVNAHIRAVAEQYALDGFVVLAPCQRSAYTGQARVGIFRPAESGVGDGRSRHIPASAESA